MVKRKKEVKMYTHIWGAQAIWEGEFEEEKNQKEIKVEKG